MTKSTKTKKEKLEHPLKIQGSFDEVMNLAIGKPPKPVKKSIKKEDKKKQ